MNQELTSELKKKFEVSIKSMSGLEKINIYGDLFNAQFVISAMHQSYLLGLDADRWIGVEDQPKMTGRYLILDDDNDVSIDIYDAENKSFMIDDAEFITHWQPLPKSPKP